MVRAAILQTEKDKLIEVNDEQIIEIIAKEAKKKRFLFLTAKKVEDKIY